MSSLPAVTADAIRIVPSILAADPTDLACQVREVQKAGADWIQVDVMDGHFVPNLTFGPHCVAALKKVTPLPLDVHLMIESPGAFLPAFAKAGASLLTVHWEACPEPQGILREIRKLGISCGLAIRPETPVERLLPYLPELDLALVMTVDPGFSGQRFKEQTLPKIRRLREEIGRLRLPCYLQVDGGVDLNTVSLVVEAGADVLVAGSAIFGRSSPARALRELREAAGVGGGMWRS
ncbi:MAG: ribulose-phosphate 3-epimerase [Elusimicrobia bacterium]|nr:ribulose-phosphate 3-epimerase [Elusimicrobiota bacterium]